MRSRSVAMSALRSRVLRGARQRGPNSPHERSEMETEHPGYRFAHPGYAPLCHRAAACVCAARYESRSRELTCFFDQGHDLVLVAVVRLELLARLSVQIGNVACGQ